MNRTAIALIAGCSLLSPLAAAAAERGSGIVNVLDFFPSGRPGGPDDGKALQAAIDATTGTLFLPAGTYLISEPLRISKPIEIAGSGVGTVIRATSCNSRWDPKGSAPLLWIRPDKSAFRDVTVRNLTLNGGCASRDDYGPGEWGAGVEIATRGPLAPGNVAIRRLHVADVGGDGVTVRGDPVDQRTEPSDVYIEDNVIERWHRNRQGIAVVAGRRVGIRRNQVVLGIPASGPCPSAPSIDTDPTDGNFGIDLETNPTTRGEFITGVWVSGNVVHNCNGGINVSNSSRDNAITDVAVYDNTVGGPEGLPRKPIQSNGGTTYMQFNNLSKTGSKLPASP